MILRWLRSLRYQEPVTAAAIRRRLAALRRQHADTLDRRDALSLDAVRHDTEAVQWGVLDDSATALERQIDVLAAALPQAEAKEAEAREQVEVAAHANQMLEYQRQTAEAQAWLDDMLARLPSGEELTQARALRDLLRDKARSLSRQSRDVSVRRPLDPLDAINEALAMRVQRIERSRWLRGDSPITLVDEKRAAS